MSATDDAPKGTAGGTRWRRQTQLVRGGIERTGFDETAEAIFMTSGYVYASAAEAEAAFKGESSRYIYSRYANPTQSMFEARLAAIEEAEVCRATASGMSAVFTTLMAMVRAGDRVVASRALFGSCQFVIAELLPRYGVETVFVDGLDLDAWAAALDRPTAAVFLETPSNPTLEIIDLPAVCDLAHQAGALVVVDNVFATPILQHPLRLGADVVVYSATKHIDGQGRALGGAILSSAEFAEEYLKDLIRHTGPCLSPFNAWLLLKGLETLEIRVAEQSRNARLIADYLEARNDVARVLYPGLASHPQHDLAGRQMASGGTLLSFDLDGGKARAFEFLDRLALIDISNNLGDAKSLITHPATTTHQRIGEDERATLGIGDGLVRLSVGLEDVEDLQHDLGQALAA